MGCTLAPPGKYDWMIHMHLRCSLASNFIDNLVAVSKGMQAVKLCTNKIVQFLTGGAGWCRLTCIMAVKQVVWGWLASLPINKPVMCDLYFWQMCYNVSLEECHFKSCILEHCTRVILNICILLFSVQSQRTLLMYLFVCFCLPALLS